MCTHTQANISVSTRPTLTAAHAQVLCFEGATRISWVQMLAHAGIGVLKVHPIIFVPAKGRPMNILSHIWTLGRNPTQNLAQNAIEFHQVSEFLYIVMLHVSD